MKQIAYGTPIILRDDKEHILKQKEALDEASIQDLVFRYPSCLPISEIDESYNPIVPVCTELNTPVGPLDIFMVTPSGELIIIETKLWRNPEARRVVVAQILDYAKELSKWSYEDLQREVNRRLNSAGNQLYEFAKKSDSNYLLDEPDFIDAVSRNLKKGSFLLLIVGDGIREGAAGIADFLVASGNLNFTFAMIEIAVFESAEIGMVLLPRVMAKTVELQKITVDIADGLQLTNTPGSIGSAEEDSDYSPEWQIEKGFYTKFWAEFVNELVFDDPGQPLPKPAKGQNLYVYPAKSRKTWISAYFMKSQRQIGVYFRCQNDPEGQAIYSALTDQKESIKADIGSKVDWYWKDSFGPGVTLPCEDVFKAENRKLIKDFFSKWLNTFVNVMRPRLKQF